MSNLATSAKRLADLVERQAASGLLTNDTIRAAGEVQFALNTLASSRQYAPSVPPSICEDVTGHRQKFQSSQTLSVGLIEAASNVIASASDTYKKRNGHLASFEDDSGEKCWIVPFDAFEGLRSAVEALATEGKS